MDGPRFRWSSSSLSDVGLVRRINEDACLDLPQHGIWAVADGMGGHAFGEVASSMVIDALAALPVGAGRPSLQAAADAVRLSLQVVNHALRAQAVMHDVTLVGSTVVVLVANDAECAILWAGDSRAYRFRDGRLQQLTRDHADAPDPDVFDGAEPPDATDVDALNPARPGGIPSAVEPLPNADDLTWYPTPTAACGHVDGTHAVAGGKRRNDSNTDLADPSRVRHASIRHAAGGITRAVGATDALLLEEIRFPVLDGDVYLLCSDGLTREARSPDITRILAPGESRHAAQTLVALALERGGRDNITAVVIAADDLWSADRTLLNPAC